MASRTALLIRCSAEEAQAIREFAEHERRTVSGYVLNILTRALNVEERLFASLNRLQSLNRTLYRTPLRLPGPRTAVLLRCSSAEADRIRTAAARRQTTISGFVLHTLRVSWSLARGRPMPP